ncbi:hypothetical protein ONA91_02225 [Micromonospora sp. DR5-3]|uniref:hypothetical protein n=1 Tax=unclassified Micromonospora TaxID=2617518 RepID=UPI0011D68E28|nr:MULTISPECIES: hypothetical protein [unclassified Micromonospora]MCW3813272.1 hypothetical protein [Micromonospora sp. DR5-3]TYC24662.1 hypothetical protein FXF52_08815 [Micromonospora sp. MP36]
MSPAVAPATAHPRDGRPAPTWAVRAAHLIPLAVLPSGLWRLALVAGVPLGAYEHGAPARTHGWESVYVVSLTVVSEALALLSLGLVRRWGEVFPRWLPLVSGRRVPPPFAVTVATAGAVGVTLVWAYAAWGIIVRGGILGFSPTGFALLLTCYVPLLLWGPLLLAVTLAYHRRRCRD